VIFGDQGIHAINVTRVVDERTWPIFISAPGKSYAPKFPKNQPEVIYEMPA
jgi:hypothetical protein